MYSPELELIRATLNVDMVSVVPVLLDSQVASLDQTEPVLSTLAGSSVADVPGIKNGEADLCDELGSHLIGLNVDGDEDDILISFEGRWSVDIKDKLVGWLCAARELWMEWIS